MDHFNACRKNPIPIFIHLFECVITVSLISLMCISVKGQEKNKAITQKDLSFKGITTKSVQTDVEKIFHKPLKIREYPDADGGSTVYVEWEYDHLTVLFEKGSTVDDVTLIDDYYCTERGIRVGDSTEKVIEKYGKPRYMDESMIDYEAPDALAELDGVTFFIEKGKVKSIRIGENEEY